MTRLLELQAAAAALPPEQQQELFLFLAGRLHADSTQVRVPRIFSTEQVSGWITDDEEGMRRFHAHQGNSQEVG